MDIKTINLIARVLKESKPESHQHIAQLYQWRYTVTKMGLAIQNQRKDFDYRAFLVKCGYN